jgi:hypothetical protein
MKEELAGLMDKLNELDNIKTLCNFRLMFFNFFAVVVFPDFLFCLYSLSLLRISFLISGFIHGRLSLVFDPSCITRVHTLPGISDHDIVFAEVDLKIKKKIQKPHSIPLYNKAKWDTMKEELAGLMDKLNELDNIKTCVNEMWCVPSR